MPGPAETHAVPVLLSWDETPAFRGIRLALPPVLARGHALPGQLVKARTAAGEGYFALASAPAPSGHAELLVKRGGRIADAVIASALPGGRLELTAPFGDGFPVEEASGRDVLLFAAGSGIAPVRAVVQWIMAHRDEVGRVTLFYGQRHGAEFAYRDEHLAWERHGVRVILCPSGEEDAWKGMRGRVHEVAHALALGGIVPGDAIAFVAGMTAMVDDVRRTLRDEGVPPARVHVNF
jgi:NAD(P)H-flavin reductase